jgi:hypothetical protein
LGAVYHKNRVREICGKTGNLQVNNAHLESGGRTPDAAPPHPLPPEAALLTDIVDNGVDFDEIRRFPTADFAPNPVIGARNAEV